MLAFGKERMEGLRLEGRVGCCAGLRGGSGMRREFEED